MTTIKLNYQDLLIVDPCYIKNVKTFGEQRFDALKLVNVLHEGDDGEYPIELASGCKWLGVDSGRIWELMAEFECEVEVDSGMSGHIVVRKDDTDWGEKIIKGNHLGE